MILNLMLGNLRNSALVLVGFILLTFSSAYSAEPPAKEEAIEWTKIIEAAKREGRLTISGDPSEEWRKSLVDLFIQEYPEIKVEYTGLGGRNFWPRVRQERELGQKLWDLRTGGVESVYTSPEYKTYLDPIRPLLLPEIADDSKWIGGLDRLFYDKEKKLTLGYTWYTLTTTTVNRDFIKKTELKSSAQLLDAKFKGKIVMQTPSGGATFAALGNMALMYGGDFVRNLLTKQNVVITDDKRQQAEWVVRGKRPIAIGFTPTQLIPFVKQGLGKNVKPLEDKIILVASGLGGICLLKDAPHPNATRVYINWLLSRNTQMQLTKNVLINSHRIDVPVVDKETAIDPKRLSKYRFYSTEENTEITARIVPTFRELLN